MSFGGPCPLPLSPLPQGERGSSRVPSERSTADRVARSQQGPRVEPGVTEWVGRMRCKITSRSRLSAWLRPGRRWRRRCLVRVAADVGDEAAPAFGLARLADVAAVQDQPVVGVELVLLRHDALEARLDLGARSLPGARPVRLPTRKTCVSTAMVGSPKAMLSTTFAVLRPTPGRLSELSRSLGTSPPIVRDELLRQGDDVLRLVADRGRWS